MFLESNDPCRVHRDNFFSEVRLGNVYLRHGGNKKKFMNWITNFFADKCGRDIARLSFVRYLRNYFTGDKTSGTV